MKDALFTRVEGVFYRAVDPAYRAYALAGSRTPGRYSSAAQPTLYLSATPEGVDAAMAAHRDRRGAGRAIVRVHVQATGICDLRDAAALAALGVWRMRPRRGRTSSRQAGDRIRGVSGNTWKPPAPTA
jgi:RES domain-containing protein